MIDILYEDNHIIVVVKKPNVLVQKDITNDIDLLNEIKEYIKNKYNKPGNVYVGLVHRLDRIVGGVMVFAKTSKSASRLSEEIRNNRFVKKYIAVVRGRMNDSGMLEDYLLKDEKTKTSRVDIKGKLSKLEYKLIRYDEVNDVSVIDINLITGRHHQIRVQFSSRNHVIVGDSKYGNETGDIYLWAYGLSFKHPVKDEIMNFTYLPKWELLD